MSPAPFNIFSMKHLLSYFFTFLFAVSCLAQQPASRKISLKILPYTNCNVYLASYYGNTRLMADTAWLNEYSEGTFQGKQKLTPGMYFLVLPDNKMMFDLLLDTNQCFTIVMDTTRKVDPLFIGSEENNIFYRYIAATKDLTQEMVQLNNALKVSKQPNDIARITQQQALLQNRIAAIRNAVIDKYPVSLTALLLLLGRAPSVPPGFVAKTRADTVAGYFYSKYHYWDNIQFNDDRLLYNALFEPKMDMYFQYYVQPAADSVIKEMDYILNYARSGQEIFPYLLLKFTNRYLNPEHIGQNKVFLDLFQNYYLRGDTVLLNATSKKVIFDRAYALMANQAGDPAPPLDMTTADGKTVSLYNIDAPYIFVVFWDPECHHCREDIPRIDSIYKAKWRALGVKLYSVNINTANMPKVQQFANEKHLSPEWIHTYQTEAAEKETVNKGLLNYHQLYDVYETPTMYLLDEKKRIIAKRLSLEQFDEVLNVRQKNEKK